MCSPLMQPKNENHSHLVYLQRTQRNSCRITCKIDQTWHFISIIWCHPIKQTRQYFRFVDNRLKRRRHDVMQCTRQGRQQDVAKCVDLSTTKRNERKSNATLALITKETLLFPRQWHRNPLFCQQSNYSARGVQTFVC